MSIVAVAGGTGRFGRTVVEAIVKAGEHKVVVLARKADDAKAKEMGVPIIAIDYNNVEAMKDTLESNNIGTIVASLETTTAPGPELSLVKAADASTVTKRFIPTTYGIKYTLAAIETYDAAQSRVDVLEALAKTSLEYVQVMCGFFADYFLTPKISSRMGPLPVLIDIAHNAAAIPGSGNVPVDMTHTADVATFIANILNLKEKWPVEAYVIGEKITLNELVACAEKAKGVKFDVKYDPMEKLQKSETTELPNQKEVYPWYPKPELQRFSAMLGTMMETGQFDLNAGENIVGFKPKTVREMIFEAWGSS